MRARQPGEAIGESVSLEGIGAAIERDARSRPC